MHNGANIDLTTVRGRTEKAGGVKLVFSTTPRCINGPVAMPAEADEAEESEEPGEVARGRVDGNITRGIELGRLG